MAAGRGGVEPEDVPGVGRALEAAGVVGVAALEHFVRASHQNHLHLRHELRRVSAGRSNVSSTGNYIIN